jgi:hypothetical protein
LLQRQQAAAPIGDLGGRLRTHTPTFRLVSKLLSQRRFRWLGGFDWREIACRCNFTKEKDAARNDKALHLQTSQYEPAAYHAMDLKGLRHIVSRLVVTLMMRPQRCAISVGTTARVIKKAAMRLTSMTPRNSSGVVSR